MKEQVAAAWSKRLWELALWSTALRTCWMLPHKLLMICLQQQTGIFNSASLWLLGASKTKCCLKLQRFRQTTGRTLSSSQQKWAHSVPNACNSDRDHRFPVVLVVTSNSTGNKEFSRDTLPRPTPPSPATSLSVSPQCHDEMCNYSQTKAAAFHGIPAISCGLESLKRPNISVKRQKKRRV